MKKKKTKQQNETPQQGPSDDFCEWWNPSGTDPISGASVGGHPDASRVWARHDAGRWVRRHYGTNAKIAWLAERYRNEFDEWVESGKPKRVKEFVSVAVPLDRLKEFWNEVRQLLSKIGKPMPKTRPKDIQAEARRMALPVKVIEPLDEKDEGAIEF